MAIELNDIYDFSKETGIVIPDTSDVRTAVAADFVEVFGPNVDTSEETHIGRFIDELTEAIVQTTGVNAQNANQFNLNYATGVFLDNLGAAFGVDRYKANRSKVAVELACSSPMTIPAGTVFANGDDYEFALTEDVEIQDGDALSDGEGNLIYVGTGEAEAVADGRIYCPAGTLTTIKTAIQGLLSVNNPLNAALGRDEETDAHYRRRIKAARFTGGGNVSAILNALYAIEDDDGNRVITEAVVEENGHSYPVSKGGVVIPAHSVYICVLGGGAETEALIAEAIYRSKSAGAGYTRDTAWTELYHELKDVSVTDPSSGVASVVSFFRPVERGLDISVEADVSQYAGADAKAVITDVIKGYLSGEGIGAEVTEAALVSELAQKGSAGIRIKSVSISRGGIAIDSVKLSIGEMFTTNTSQADDPRLAINITLTGV